MGGRPLHRWGFARLAQLSNLPVSKKGAAGHCGERGPMPAPRHPCRASAEGRSVHWAAGLALTMERLDALSGDSALRASHHFHHARQHPGNTDVVPGSQPQRLPQTRGTAFRLRILARHGPSRHCCHSTDEAIVNGQSACNGVKWIGARRSVKVPRLLGGGEDACAYLGFPRLVSTPSVEARQAMLAPAGLRGPGSPTAVTEVATCRIRRSSSTSRATTVHPH